MRALLLGFLALTAILIGPAPAAEPVTTRGSLVVCVSSPAAEVGAAILKQGGNAVDAAVAVALAEAVTWPEAGNIGGGGFMLIRPADGKNPIVVDYREMAPASATKDLFAKGLDVQSILTAGVPGTVRGLALAHQKYGKLPWKDLVLPAVKLAENGVPVNAALARSLNGPLAEGKTKNEEFRKVYGKPNNARWTAGDTLKLPDLARTLKLIADDPEAFYTGKPAELLVAEMKKKGGLITLEDLKAYKPIIRPAMTGTYRGHEIIGAPPPSSGGTILLETLNILEHFDLKKHKWGSVETTHLVAEAMKRSFADRARYLGDPAFTKIPDFLTTKAHAKKWAETIDLAKATPSEKLAPEIAIAGEGQDTTHFSIIDKDGLAVSNTYTLENAFGCRIVVPGAGYILDNEMTDFNPIPGTTTRTGKIGTEPNLIAPGKRMLSSMTPTMVARDGKLILITGSPGGRTIINTVLSVVVNVVDYEANVVDAVAAPRMHHQWFPDQVSLEDRPGFDDLTKELKARGHTVVKRKQGDAHSIAIDPKTGIRTGGPDLRLDGKAIAVD